MADYNQSVQQLIQEFRVINTKGAITPDSLGYLLERLYNEAGSAGSGSAHSNIHVEVVDGEVRLYGGEALEQKGYVPYLFRHTKRMNRKTVIDENGEELKLKSRNTKGWHLYGSRHSIKVQNTFVLFSTNSPDEVHREAEGYSGDIENLIHVKYSNIPHKRQIPWGRARIMLYNKQSNTERMLRLRFAIAYAKPYNPAKKRINTRDLVSNLAEFAIIYDPMGGGFKFSR